MTAKIAKYWLLKDTVSRTASAALAAQTNHPDHELVPALTVDNIPNHCMLSLSNLLCGSDNAPDFADRISIGLGKGDSISDFGIELSEVAQEANSAPQSARPEDIVGNTFLILKVLIKFTDAPGDDLVSDIDLRVQFLLDQTARSYRPGLPIAVPTTDGSTIIDKTVHPLDGVIYRYWKSITPTNVLEREVLFFQDVNRVFLC